MLEERKRFCDADKFIVSYICYREFKESYLSVDVRTDGIMVEQIK